MLPNSQVAIYSKGRKADRALCLVVERLESIAQYNAKLQGLESVGIPTKQFHSRK